MTSTVGSATVGGVWRRSEAVEVVRSGIDVWLRSRSAGSILSRRRSIGGGAAMIGRRTFLTLAATAAVTSTVPSCGRGDDVATVRLGAGRVGGMFLEFAQLLARVAAESGTVHIEPVVTDGSHMNLDLLGSGRIDAALSLADAVRPSGADVRAIGRLHESYIQMAVRTDSAISQVGDLRGKRVDLGQIGSGAAMTGERILRVAGLDPATDVVVGNRRLPEAIPALLSGEMDAIVWGGGVPTPGLAVPQQARLIDLGELVKPLQERFGYDYDQVVIPADAYPGNPAVATVGVPNLLLAAPTLADATVTALTELLLSHADGLMPAQALGFQFLDKRWLVGTGEVRLHPAAAARYRDEHG
ncbi:TAXI family TRAP transporter solute-binding subunit [Nocardia pneumoniae]|uniref:TAXI family TRAP transporter solute-binding subunit n=1 Tax=Nocardia pneumoniae TaxID=228601 RepID=UPI001FDED6BB|nr:TAXI family TRAP transporter solute-binding subunit [Nocardia pneumoniae]